MNIELNPEQTLEHSRYNMVVQQIRPWYVLDDEVLDLFYKLHREEFVPAAYRHAAFVDMEIPLGHGQIMLAPKMEARILQELHISKSDKILEVGTGSGYMAALLAQLGNHVYSVEIIPELKQMAEANLKAHNITNVTVEQGDAAHGWSKHEPYDVIVITGSTPVLPDSFKNSLNTGGRLFAVVGEDPIMEAKVITCVAPGEFTVNTLFETSTPALINAEQTSRFTF
ncbi:protein-L-isoaspartate O-methyltransferase [Nitrosomonas sp.]|uniref:protein-L-isoaspartate O-methyltransferase family protein n=1 Tax=Nitrosomonas sp. TaxID=42353 RepID=UPI001DEFF049|nr:protein-L-isoaspartate O-methyltransferase [Nitrosomonas sp.]MCB1948528.1 protein-L-isoaspartate O-methyltransferase [Nitrosomonas sp.]MCP5243825.1 protein-L-isoaspartate O-methyltransferase [Burkholderiales bacterium]MCP5292734.1 protein-L-isoaspartate O-methyltransferase [Burkholderiales bacterium]MDR4515386.1 protein-L-isoaspartate O-methyltransferase [Nitrosomonas sp.]